ncbi:hypothetical protein F5Y14DRAFT_48744 [Nemania sp. NC0429]|nr:hypothetical protein F5Y14DRAFT_48744 [Nemania sp. NC0429]
MILLSTCQKNAPRVRPSTYANGIEIDDRVWDRRPVDLHAIISPDSESGGEKKTLVSTASDICLVFASASAIRNCELCRTYFIDQFRMPPSWWSDSSRKSNGYFGCRVTAEHIDTWAYFETKQVKEKDTYHWYKLNAFIRWNKSTHQTIVISFDTPPVIATRFLELVAAPGDNTAWRCPMWFYPHLVGEVARLQELAVWAIRDRVRAVEKKPMSDGRPQPDYRHLHDIARHAVHVTETLDVSVQTVQRMLARHRELMQQQQQLQSDEGQSQESQSQLEFYESFLTSLRQRSVSNEKRMANEIQLAFNIVAQHDASTSVKIGLATQSDSVAMKSIAFVTLTFLPPTFVCAIFSMSFFDYSADAGWAISDKFWLYWAFAVPTTLLTVAAWYYASKRGFRVSPRSGRQRFNTGLLVEV